LVAIFRFKAGMIQTLFACSAEFKAPARFAMSELIARIKALLRRPGGVLGITLEAGNLRLDTVGRELMIAGAPVRVSRQELAILEQMMRRFGRIVPKAVLEESKR
jgi:DNA-binding response OmpR family regulator